VASNPRDINQTVQQILDRGGWRQKLATDYGTTAERLTTAYNRLLPKLHNSAGLFSQRLKDWQAANDGALPSAQDARNLTEYQNLLLNVETELRDFAAIVRNEAGTIQEQAIVTGSDAAAQMAQDFSGTLATVVEGMWNRPAPETLQQVINYVDGAAYREKAGAFGANAAQNLGDVLLVGVAQGKNPRTIANIMTNWFDVPLAWANNSVQTVQLYSYRAANHESYLANPDVLEGWVWWADLSGACMSCVDQHGSIHPLTETLQDHHQGRCSPVPIVKGSKWPELVMTGSNWFESQSESVQQQQMGGALFNAWQDGSVSWGDFSEKYSDDVFGDMLREASLSGILGKKEATRFYT